MWCIFNAKAPEIGKGSIVSASEHYIIVYVLEIVVKLTTHSVWCSFASCVKKQLCCTLSLCHWQARLAGSVMFSTSPFTHLLSDL